MGKPNSCVFSLIEEFVYILVTLIFRVSGKSSHEGNKRVRNGILQCIIILCQTPVNPTRLQYAIQSIYTTQ